MNKMPKPRSLLLLAALAPVALMLFSTDVCAQTGKGGAAAVVGRVSPQDRKGKDERLDCRPRRRLARGRAPASRGRDGPRRR